MALSAATTWEVRTTGSDTLCSGGFVTGATGTDYSKQDAAQFTGTDLVIDAVTNTKVTSATHNFVAADVGNLIQITAGTGFTTGFYQIISVASNAATLDRSPGVVGLTGGTWAEGGALLTLAKLAGAMVASNWAFIKAGSGYTSNATTTFAQSVLPTDTVSPTRLTGYTTTRGDGGKATLTLQTNTGLTGIASSSTGWIIENLTVDCANLGTSIGFSFPNSSRSAFINCKATNFKTAGFNGGGQAYFFGCEVTGAASTGIGIATGTTSLIRGNYIHDTTAVGLSMNSASMAVRNLIVNNTGAASDGIQMQSGQQVLVEHNTIYNAGRHGIHSAVDVRTGTIILNNLLSQNGGYGIKFALAAPALPYYDGNAYYSNTSGTRNNMDSVAGIYAAAPYTNVRDVTLSADPFTNKATGNFSLNTTAGGGAAARSAGIPGAFPGSSVVGYPDMGAVDHADPVSSGGAGFFIQ